jgi:hypothetical protein
LLFDFVVPLFNLTIVLTGARGHGQRALELALVDSLHLVGHLPRAERPPLHRRGMSGSPAVYGVNSQGGRRVTPLVTKKGAVGDLRRVRAHHGRGRLGDRQRRVARRVLPDVGEDCRLFLLLVGLVESAADEQHA